MSYEDLEYQIEELEEKINKLEKGKWFWDLAGYIILGSIIGKIFF